MLRISVAFEVDLPLKSLVTESAREGLVARVLPHVGDQVGRLRKRFLAHNALVGLLTCKVKLSYEAFYSVSIVV